MGGGPPKTVRIVAEDAKAWASKTDQPSFQLTPNEEHAQIDPCHRGERHEERREAQQTEEESIGRAAAIVCGISCDQNTCVSDRQDKNRAN